jgi:hypothetical protein
MDPQVDVVQHHGDNAESAQKVNAGDALLCFLGCDRLGHETFSLKGLLSESLRYCGKRGYPDRLIHFNADFV